MVWTTPTDKTNEHKKEHKFSRGCCIYCGWYCVDCPPGVATCKCIPKGFEEIKHDRFAHTYEDICGLKWCRIHFSPEFGQHTAYPFRFNIKTSTHGWQNIYIYCGPGAYLPTRRDYEKAVEFEQARKQIL